MLCTPLLIQNITSRRTGRFHRFVNDMAQSELWFELMEEFRCLWDRQDPRFADATMQIQGYQQLLRKYNSRIDFPIDMEMLKLWVADFQRLQTGRIPKKSQRRTKPKKDLIAELLKEFPCLWDPEDLNYLDRTLRARAREQLLEKYNTRSSSPIDIEQLKVELQVMARQHQTRRRRYTKPKKDLIAELLKEFPCLWDPQDLNYLDRTLRARAREQLLEKYNTRSSSPIDIEQLKVELQVMARQHHTSGPERVLNASELIAELIGEFPCLWDRKDSSFLNSKRRKRARDQLLAKYNARSSTPIDMMQLKRKLRQKYMAKTDAATAAPRTRMLNLRWLQPDGSHAAFDSTEALAEKKQQEPTNHPQHSAIYIVDSDSDDNETVKEGHKDEKFNPISVTDTEFVKNSVDVYIKETDEGKRRVYIDLNTFSLPYEDKSNEDNTSAHKNAEVASEITMTQTKIREDTEALLGELDRSEAVVSDAIEMETVRETTASESVTDKMKMTSEMMYSVEVPRIFKCISEHTASN